MKTDLLRSLVMMITYAFCGVSLLMWLYLLVWSIVLRITTRSLNDLDRNKRYAKVFTHSMKSDIPSMQASARKAFLITGVFLLVIWLFGNEGEQSNVRALFEQLSIWLYLFIGAGIVIGTVMTMIVPSDASEPTEIARTIRKGSAQTVWLAIVYFVIIWLIA